MSYQEVISVADPDWQKNAEDLMQRRRPFVLVGWKLGFDETMCSQMAIKNRYRYRADIIKGRGFFDPISDESKS